MNRSMGEGGDSIYNGRRLEMAIIIDLDWREKLISGTSGQAIAVCRAFCRAARRRPSSYVLYFGQSEFSSGVSSPTFGAPSPNELFEADG